MSRHQGQARPSERARPARARGRAYQRDLEDKHEHDLEEKNKIDLEEDGRNFEVEHERDLDEGGGRDVEDERNQRGLEEEDSTCATERRRTIKRDPRGLERSTAFVVS
jgi:hypothetical protein